MGVQDVTHTKAVWPITSNIKFLYKPKAGRPRGTFGMPMHAAEASVLHNLIHAKVQYIAVLQIRTAA